MMSFMDDDFGASEFFPQGAGSEANLTRTIYYTVLHYTVLYYTILYYNIILQYSIV